MSWELFTSLFGLVGIFLKWLLDPDRRRGQAIKQTEDALRRAIRDSDMQRLTELVSDILDRSRRARK